MELPAFTTELVGDSERARRAAAALRALEIPSEREEIWRYTDLSDLDLTRYRPTATAFTFDGAAGESFGEGPGLIPPDQDVFTALAAGFGTGATVRLPAGPRHVVHIESLGEGVDSAHMASLHIDAAANSDSLVVLRHAGTAGLNLPVVEVTVGDNARLAFVDVQETGPQTVHIATTRLRMGRDSTVRSVAVGLGARFARLLLECEMAGEGGDSVMLGLYFGEGSQRFDFRTLQDHHAPHCRSEVLYKGAVADSAQAVYSGLIYVAPGAFKTDGYQTNRNLILSPKAWAESIPKLEILNNDVRCSHASAVGPVDEDVQYYLESRGLDPEVARRLAVFGFFEEVLRRLPDPALEAGLRLAVADKFARAVTAREGEL